jgi:hypothetical protein
VPPSAAESGLSLEFDPSPIRFLLPLALLVAFVLASGLGACALRRRWAVFRVLLASGLALGAAYAMLLPMDGMISGGRLLQPGEEKLFCGLDCDLAVSVASVERSAEIGPPGRPGRPRGTFYVVGVKIRSDAVRVTMDPSRLGAWIVDDEGRRYPPRRPDDDPAAPLFCPVAPGQWYILDLLFDVPADLHAPRLLVGVNGGFGRMIPGAENALFHRRTMHRL